MRSKWRIQGGVQGVRTPALLIGVPFLKKCMFKTSFKATPVPLIDGLDTRPCKILDPRLCCWYYLRAYLLYVHLYSPNW